MHNNIKYTCFNQIYPFLSFFLKFDYFCEHIYYPKYSSMIWTLDYDKQSDFDNTVGIWHVKENPNNKEVCVIVLSF